jgi:hypothetical protein
MKTVIRRHVRTYHVFRALAIAQAIKKIRPDEEVFIECLDEHKHVLDLAPGVKWKNPHHPFEVVERLNENQNLHRKAGPLYDRVIDIDSEGPFEARQVAFGGSFWAWVVSVISEKNPELAGEIQMNPWPSIEIPLPKPAAIATAGCVLIAPISQESNPIEINANALAAWAEKAFPGVPQLWATFGRNFGPGRIAAPFSSLPELAGVIAAAKAVVTVKGIIAGLAQAAVPGRGRLAKILVLVTDRAKPGPAEPNPNPKRPKFKPASRPSALSLPGPLLDLGEAAQAVKTLPNATAILEPQIDGSLKELTPHPAD